MSKSAESGSLILLRIEGNVATVTLNRPQRHNSLIPELLEQILDAFRSIAEQQRSVKLVILQVTGGSLGLILACDIVVVTDRASFTPYCTEVGFGPDGGWTALLPDIIGRHRAAAVQLLNDTISGQQAVDWGIAYALVESKNLQQALDDLCARLLRKRAGSIRLTKRLLRIPDYRERLDRERQAFIRQVTTREAVDGVKEIVAASREDT